MLERSDASILIIQDEKAIRNNYVAFFKMHYQAVYEANSSEDGYKVYLNKKPNIIIVDININNIDNINMVKEIRKTDFDTKIIVLVASIFKNYFFDTNDLELTKYLKKPISRADLTEALILAEEELMQKKKSVASF